MVLYCPSFREYTNHSSNTLLIKYRHCISMGPMVLTEQRRRAFFALQCGGPFSVFPNNLHLAQHGMGISNLFGHPLFNGYQQPINLDYLNGFAASHDDSFDPGFINPDNDQSNNCLPMATVSTGSAAPPADSACIDPTLQATEM